MSAFRVDSWEFAGSDRRFLAPLVWSTLERIDILPGGACLRHRSVASTLP